MRDFNSVPRVGEHPNGFRSDIEAAARLGYLDAVAGRGPSREYETQEDKWQRNYEIGRLWVSSMRAAGLTPPEWAQDQSRPIGFAKCLAAMRAKVGDIVPRTGQILPPDPNLVLHALVPDIRRGRIIERMTT